MVSVRTKTRGTSIPVMDMGGYPHYMLKEINEQGEALRNSLEGRIRGGRVDLSSELPWTKKDVASWKKLHLVACGTSYYSALAAEHFLESMTDLDTRVEIASEYSGRNIPTGPDTLAVFVSQSGETTDTLRAERRAREKGARCLAVTNVLGSTLATEVPHVLQLKAGPEIGVAATKSFTGQLTVLYALALYLAKMRGAISTDQERLYCEELEALTGKVEAVLGRASSLQGVAARFQNAKNFFFLGRGASRPIAFEGALKLKEISYVHAEGFPAGEFRHGPMALLEEGVPVVFISPEDEPGKRNLSLLKDIKEKKSPVFAIVTEGDTAMGSGADHVFSVPKTLEEFSPFLTVLPLQLFAYYFAKGLGRPIDQPRGLTKSVVAE